MFVRSYGRERGFSITAPEALAAQTSTTYTDKVSHPGHHRGFLGRVLRLASIPRTGRISDHHDHRARSAASACRPSPVPP
jgi:hypothetical protein